MARTTETRLNVSSPNPTSLVDAIEAAISEYQTDVAEKKLPPSDRVLSVRVLIRVEDFFCDRILKIFRDAEPDTLRAVSVLWTKLTGERK